MPQTNTIRIRADWVRILEATADEEPDDRRWAEQVLAAARPVFPRAAHTGMVFLPTDEDLLDSSLVVIPGMTNPQAYLEQLTKAPPDAFRAFVHPPVPVTTHGEILRSLSDDDGSWVRREAPASQFADSLGLVVHPIPAMTVVFWAGHESAIDLSAHERELLTRVAAHIESGYRARKMRGAVRAVISQDGRVLSRTDHAPPNRALEAHAQRMIAARSRSSRETADAIALWPALLDGRMTLVPRGTSSSRRYDVIDNAPDTTKIRALTEGERRVLDACASGLSGKLIAYSLGLSQSVVSSRLGAAAWKLGLASRLELLRVASLLGGSRANALSDAQLSASEREVLVLLERGLSNKQIAELRSRSTRTIANQVAALLRKTKAASRRELIARATRRFG